MSQKTSDSIDENVLARFSMDSEESPGIIEAGVDDLVWRDAETEQDGTFDIQVRYKPEEWIVYPATLKVFISQFEDLEMRPEDAGEYIKKQLVSLLFDSRKRAEGNMVVLVQADTTLDEYNFSFGEIK